MKDRCDKRNINIKTVFNKNSIKTLKNLQEESDYFISNVLDKYNL